MEAPEVCAVDLELDFAPGIPTALTRAFSGSELLGDIAEELSAEVELLGIALAAESGVADLEFVDHLRVRAEAAGVDELETVELIDARRPADHPPDELWSVAATSRPNLVEYLYGPELVIAVELRGDMPESPFSLTTELCFSARASYGF